MKFENRKTKTTLIALLLMLTIAIPLFALQGAQAHDPPRNVPTYSYIHVAPDPVGVGQTVNVVFWIDAVPPTAAGNAGDAWWFFLDITAPDGTKETDGPFKSDPVGGSYAAYTFDTAGNYTFAVRFGPQVVTGSNGTGIYNYNIAINNTYLASSATTTLTVQEESIPNPPTYPLPTEYWTRPIEGQNDQWYQIASNWLRGSQIVGGIVQNDGIAPNSAHIMWTRSLEDGGVVGGNQTSTTGMTYYDGSAYEGKGRNPFIINGRFYYALPRSGSPSGDGYVCVDLRTGEKLFWQNATFPTFAQLYDYESMNQHGVVPNGYMWSTSGTTWNAYDSIDGNWLFTLTDVPSGTEAYTKNGEIVRYVINVGGKWLALWNNTAAHDLTASTNPTDYTSTNYNQWRPVGKTVNASTAYSWNVSIPWCPTGATIVGVIQNDILLGRNGSLPAVGSSWSPYTVWAVSLKPESRGSLLWMKNYDAPAGNLSRSIRQIDPVNRVFIAYDQQVMKWSGYSLDNGNWLWTTPSEEALNFYSLTTGMMGNGGFAVAYGKLYSTGYSGIVYCYDTTTGDLLWNYTAYGGLAVPSGAYSTLIGAIADGKIYLSSYEHSANAPHWKGSQMWCLDANTGKTVWTVDGWFADYSMAVADGYLVTLDDYNLQYYCFGKGPSATTVEAPMNAITQGSSVVIRGTVTDTAAGTTQNEQKARFPNGVPAVSDDSMTEWMEYVYMQKPRPANATGVPVAIYVLDNNGNYRNIGNTTSDANGCYSFQWTPDISGKYTVIATFDGSESYWPSHAETAFAVDEAAPTPTEQPAVAAPPTEMYCAISTAAIIIAIAIVGVLILLAVRKRPIVVASNQ
jgi:outer membrane protein assembly factor BamB